MLKNKNFKYFTLDVFKSNQLAFLWYKKLGLVEENSIEWKEIIPSKNLKVKKLSNKIQFKNDTNGFSSLFLENYKIATIINNSTMLIHDISFIDIIPINNHIIITNQDTLSVNEMNYQFINLETSMRMNGLLTTVLNKLKN